jgi:hypothetical protein
MSGKWDYKDKALFVRATLEFGCRLSAVYGLLDTHNLWIPMADNEWGTIKIKSKRGFKHAGTIDIMGLDGVIHTEVSLWKSPFLNRFWVRLEDLV